MPKLVSELAQGNQFSRSSDGGQLADTATRVFKIILDSPSESIDIMSAVGVQIGDPYSSANPIPCVSVEGRADGESRLVRIVTCQYRTSGMVDGGDGGTGMPDPMLVMPTIRPANFSTSTSLYEMPAVKWVPYPQGNQWLPVANSAGDIMDGVSRLAPVTTIRVTQFETFPGTARAEHCGKINSIAMGMGNFLSCGPHTVMFRGVEATPHVETFGNAVYSGFMNSYEFMYRPNFIDGEGEIGWDVLVPLSGFNTKVFDPAAPRGDQDPFALPLQRNGEYGPIIEPFKLQKKAVNSGGKVRAMVKVAGAGDEVYQSPSAQPVPLNEDGTARSDTSDPKVILWRRQVQTAINLTGTLQLRIN
jgi:hypothetical protein